MQHITEILQDSRRISIKLLQLPVVIIACSLHEHRHTSTLYSHDIIINAISH